jgi:hypothetical protein
VSLGIVGRVLLDALDDLESAWTPKPLLVFLESGAAGKLGSRLSSRPLARVPKVSENSLKSVLNGIFF